MLPLKDSIAGKKEYVLETEPVSAEIGEFKTEKDVLLNTKD